MPRLILLALVAVAVLAPRATAGTYDVYGCRMPDGGPAPASGWIPQGSISHDLCWAGQGLTAELPTPAIYTNVASGWRFVAPPDTTIDNFTIYRYAESESVWPWGRDYVSSYDDANPLGLTDRNPDYCLSHFTGCIGAGVAASVYAADNRVERTGVNAKSLLYEVLCWSYGGGGVQTCAPGSRTPGRLTIFAARMGLADRFSPTIDVEPAGPLLTGAAVSGLTAVTLAASDRGSGLARVWFEIDGNRYGERPVDAAHTSCMTPYTASVPCPLHADIGLALDTGTLANGAHTLRAVVSDAAGNETATRGFEVTIDNPVDVRRGATAPPAPNGRNASRFARLKTKFARTSRAHRTVGYGGRAVAQGQVTTSAGEPIADAIVSVEERVLGAVAAPRLAFVRTDSSGGFSYAVAAGSSRVVRFSYKADINDPAPAVAGQVTMHVRAGVSLRVSPQRVRNGTAITFRGRVLGERGFRRALVKLYALSPGPRKRIPVETVRARSDGRFVYRYRFRSIPGPSTYRFEARVPRQNGFPYSEGASRVVVVHGRP